MNKLGVVVGLAVTVINTASCSRVEPSEEARGVAEAPRVAAAGPAQEPSVTNEAPPRSPHDIGADAVRVPIDGLPAFGVADALVTIVAFTDYQGPYCAKADARIATLRGEYGDRVRLVVASHPLPMHAEAPLAARAFLAAVELGKGEAMHRRLFVNQDAISEEGVRVFAKELGLDVAAFDRARRSSATDAALRHAEQLGATLSVSATPTFFVNGRRLVGARSTEALRALIDEELVTARALVARGVAASRVYAEILAASPPPSPPKSAGPEEVFDVSIEDAPTRGPADAPVTIVFFSDFECPYCVKAEGILRAVEAAKPGTIRVAFRHKPLPMHPHARLAARASVAASLQHRFWEYHDALVLHPDALERGDLVRYAAEVHLDRVRFELDLDDPATDVRVSMDERRASALDVTGTPTAFVNGRRINGAQPVATWLGVVERSLEPAQR